MIQFDFILTEEDAELLFDCIQQEIANLKQSMVSIASTENSIMFNERAKYAIEQHIARLERIKEHMYNKRVG